MTNVNLIFSRFNFYKITISAITIIVGYITVSIVSDRIYYSRTKNFISSINELNEIKDKQIQIAFLENRFKKSFGNIRALYGIKLARTLCQDEKYQEANKVMHKTYKIYNINKELKDLSAIHIADLSFYIKDLNNFKKTIQKLDKVSNRGNMYYIAMEKAIIIDKIIGNDFTNHLSKLKEYNKNKNLDKDDEINTIQNLEYEKISK